MKRVLIAHQSTISHYRVPFYNALEKAKPDNWMFEVVQDVSGSAFSSNYNQATLEHEIEFAVLPVRSIAVAASGRAFGYQFFWRKAGKYDLVVVEHVLQNLTYPLVQFHQSHGAKVAYWGHGYDHAVSGCRGFKAAMEAGKLWLARKANGYFAYSDDVKQYLVERGLDPVKVFVINNTVDILEQRRLFDAHRNRRNAIREKLGVGSSKLLLFVGRITEERNLTYLMDVMRVLNEVGGGFSLLIVGGGGESLKASAPENVCFLGPIQEPTRLADLYVAADLYVLPGSIGLGPLQAACYDLPLMTLRIDTHGPEIAYCDDRNSVMLPANASPGTFASELKELMNNADVLSRLRQGIWPSVSHLTVENMAEKFAAGISRILSVDKK